MLLYSHFHTLYVNQSKKTSTVYKAMLGRYESKLENSKKGLGAILSRVEFQTGPRLI